MPGMEIASLYARIGADLTGLNSGLRTADRKLSSFGGTLSKVGMGITAAITAPLVGLGAKAVQTAGEFESAVNLMGIAAKGAGVPLESLRKAALAVGEDTQLIGINAMEASDAITVLLKSGMSAADVFGNLQGYLAGTADLGGALRASVDLAAASNLEFAQSADAISIALATFGRPATAATAIANNFVAAADASVAEVNDLTDAFTTFGPTANQFGWELEDVNTALALLSQRGIRGSEAGTALKSMMTNMMRQTGDTVGTLEKLNITLYDQEGQMRTMPDILGQLERALAGVSEEQRNNAIQTIFGTYGMKAAAGLLAEGTDGWQEMEGAIGEAASAQEIAQKRTEGFQGALEQLEGAIQTLMIEAGTPLIENVLTPMVKNLTDLTNAINDLPDFAKSNLGKTLVGIAAVGPGLMVAGGAIRTLASLKMLLGGGAAAAGAGAAGAAGAGGAAAAGAGVVGGLTVGGFAAIVAGTVLAGLGIGYGIKGLASDKGKEWADTAEALSESLDEQGLEGAAKAVGKVADGIGWLHERSNEFVDWVMEEVYRVGKTQTGGTGALGMAWDAGAPDIIGAMPNWATLRPQPQIDQIILEAPAEWLTAPHFAASLADATRRATSMLDPADSLAAESASKQGAFWAAEFLRGASQTFNENVITTRDYGPGYGTGILIEARAQGAR